MSKYAKIFEYFRQCPELARIWSISAVEEDKIRVILPQGASPTHQYQEFFDNLNNYCCEIVPYPSVYEDFHINCYQAYDPKDSTAPFDNYNVLQLEEVETVCKWVKQQNEIKNFPEIGEKIVSIECNPSVPQIRYVNDTEKIICYFITVRIRYVNRAQRKTVEYECED